MSRGWLSAKWHHPSLAHKNFTANWWPRRHLNSLSVDFFLSSWNASHSIWSMMSCYLFSTVEKLRPCANNWKQEIKIIFSFSKIKWAAHTLSSIRSVKSFARWIDVFAHSKSENRLTCEVRELMNSLLTFSRARIEIFSNIQNKWNEIHQNRSEFKNTLNNVTICHNKNTARMCQQF